MRHWVIYALVTIVAAAAGAGATLYFAGLTRVEVAAGAMRGQILALNPPPGTLTTEQNADSARWCMNCMWSTAVTRAAGSTG